MSKKTKASFQPKYCSECKWFESNYLMNEYEKKPWWKRLFSPSPRITKSLIFNYPQLNKCCCPRVYNLSNSWNCVNPPVKDRMFCDIARLGFSYKQDNVYWKKCGPYGDYWEHNQ